MKHFFLFCALFFLTGCTKNKKQKIHSSHKKTKKNQCPKKHVSGEDISTSEGYGYANSEGGGNSLPGIL